MDVHTACVSVRDKWRMREKKNIKNIKERREWESTKEKKNLKKNKNGFVFTAEKKEIKR